MDLSIIIVSYNVKEKLRQNLAALYNSQGDFSFEVIVVDNDSQDGSAAMVQNEFPQVRLIANSENFGFSKANNQAIKIAQGNYILLLNPDMQLFPETLINMLSWGKENQQAVVFSGRLIDIVGENIPHVRRFPKWRDQLAIVLKLPHLFPKITNKYLLAKFDYSRAQKVDSVRGSFFFINRQTWQKISGSNLPLLDERYFIWFEEVDFCRQVYQKGGEVWYTPQGKALDYVGQSFSQVKTVRKQQYFRRSQLRYFAKWHNWGEVLILRAAWALSGLICLIWRKK
ncbi:MAG TPA: glycosyltransferase family 2 protein [bacterium]|nr:glycosyltransferase family 2 protein [bacterium]HPT29717.1 glycosyltransferase family 2 protein [bacterium]